MDTYFVEPFNYVLNIFHDKRFGKCGYSHYAMWTDLAIMHWNEDVTRSRISYRFWRQLWARENVTCPITICVAPGLKLKTFQLWIKMQHNN